MPHMEFQMIYSDSVHSKESAYFFSLDVYSQQGCRSLKDDQIEYVYGKIFVKMYIQIYLTCLSRWKFLLKVFIGFLLRILTTYKENR